MKTQLHTLIKWSFIDLKSIWWHFWINVFASSILTPRFLRYFIYKLFKLDIRTPSMLGRTFIASRNLHVGKRSFINYGCYFENLAHVKIGNGCSIAMEVMFCTASHLIGAPDQRAGEVDAKPIIVGNGTWIGTRSTILGGVTIGEGCIIAANSLVNKDCEPNSIYAGVPARKIRQLE
ncbi:acyltransferase [Paenibacillaceae bacterium]|nr:acyltransferase [Paenibacillaceae bacterium]